MTDDEQDWIKRSLRGDSEAFESLVRRYQRMIYSLAYRMTGSASEAEDLTQETFIRAHGDLVRFRSEAKFSSWLYRIAMNLCLNWRKRMALRDAVYNEWQGRLAQNEEGKDERDERINEALRMLHAKQRAAIVLTVYDGLSHAEAARVLGCSETTVSWRVFAARAKLKRLLNGVKTGGEYA